MVSYTSKLLISEAIKRGWKARLLDSKHTAFIEIVGPDGKPHLLYSCVTDATSAVGLAINRNKLATYMVAEGMGIPTAEYVMYDRDNTEATSLFCRAEFAAGHELVVKPIDRDHASGVSVGLRGAEEVAQAINFAGQYSDKIIIQRRYHGKDFRVTVVDGRFVAAAWRKQPTVVGDGHSTIAQLVAHENTRRTTDKHDTTKALVIGVADVERYLGKGRLHSVPAKGEEVTVIGTANFGKGGETIDVTDVVHDSYIRAVERLADYLQLGVCGADFLAADFTKPMERGSCILLEINCAIGLRTHHSPTRGKPRNVAGAILDAFARQHGYVARNKVLSN